MAPLHEVAGSVGGVLAMLSIGGAVALADTTDAAAVLRSVERTGQPSSAGYPPCPVALVEDPALAGADTSSVRAVVAGTSVVSPSAVQRVEDALGADVIRAYDHAGAPSALMTSPDDDDVTKAETVGTPLSRHDVRIVRTSGATADCGEHGELLIRSLMTMDGYFGAPSDTAAAIDNEGWLHTGDSASMDEHGVVRIHGRFR